jgi:hypothetical protein
MTKEVLKKNIEDMEIYLPISKIEKNLGMPKTTIQQVLNGNRNLPKKWVKILEKYFKEKLYLSKVAEHEIKVGDKVNLPQEALVTKVEKKDGANKISFDEISDKPTRIKGESGIDYSIRLSEWEKNKKAPM